MTARRLLVGRFIGAVARQDQVVPERGGGRGVDGGGVEGGGPGAARDRQRRAPVGVIAGGIERRRPIQSGGGGVGQEERGADVAQPRAAVRGGGGAAVVNDRRRRRQEIGGVDVGVLAAAGRVPGLARQRQAGAGQRRVFAGAALRAGGRRAVADLVD